MAKKSKEGVTYIVEHRLHSDPRLAELGVEQTVLIPETKAGESRDISMWDTYANENGVIIIDDVLEQLEGDDYDKIEGFEVAEEGDEEIDADLLDMLRSGNFRTVDAAGDLIEIENIDDLQAALEFDDDDFEYYEDEDYEFGDQEEEEEEGIIYEGIEGDADDFATSIFGEAEAADGDFEVEYLAQDLARILKELGGEKNLDLDTESTYYSKRGFLIHRFDHQKALEAVGRENVLAAADMLHDSQTGLVQLKYLLEKKKEKTTYLDKNNDSESNRPTRVSVPQKIKIAKNGMPLEAFDTPEEESESEDSELVEIEIDLTRRPDETKEEKKARKKAAKELQAAKRKQKKAFKEAFSNEERKLKKSRADNSGNILGKTI